MNEPIRFDLIEFPMLHLDEVLVRAGRYLHWVTADQVKASFPHWVSDFCTAITDFYWNNAEYHYEVLSSQIETSPDEDDSHPAHDMILEHRYFVERMRHQYSQYKHQYVKNRRDVWQILQEELELELLPDFFNEVWFDFVINNTPEDTAKLKALPYDEYLKTPHWRRVRSAALIVHNRICSEESCHMVEEPMHANWMQDLHIHHWNYDSRGNERYKDIVVVCKGHHNALHNGYEINIAFARKIVRDRMPPGFRI